MLVIGNLNIDLVCYPVNVLPAWGKERTCDIMFSRPAGSAGYAALALGKLGIAPVVLGNVGNDQNGSQILDALVRAGADTTNVWVTSGPTGVSIALANGCGERAFVTWRGHLGELAADPLVAAVDSTPDVGYALLAGYFLLPALGPAGALGILRACRERGATTLLDTGDDPRGWETGAVREVRDVLREVDVFLPNRDEAVAVAGTQDVEDAAQRILAFGPDTVVVKDGERGSLFASRLLGLTREPAIKVPVLDATGAGDAFNAGVIFALVSGFEPQKVLQFATAVAALAISGGGPRFPTLVEAMSLLRHQYPAAWLT